LNKVAVIDTQQHAGNRWNDLSNPFNAVNRNDSSSATLYASLFITNPASGFVYNPTYPTNSAVWPYVNDQGWFKNLLVGNPYQCGNTLCRDITSKVNISPDILRAIVGDSIITSFYVPESQSINQSVAYEAFLRDTALWYSSQEYLDFVAAMRTNSIGMLYDTKEDFVKLYAYDLGFVMQVLEIDSVINETILRINEYDSLAFYNNSYTGNATRDGYLQQLQTKMEDRQSLFYAHDANNGNILADVGMKIVLVTTGEMPQQNEKDIYEIELDIHKNGEGVAENYVTQLYSIAVQCPYSGGNAVFKARAILESMYDTIYWDDVNLCFGEGIYRQAKGNQKAFANNIIVQPNPSSGILEIVKTYSLNNNCNVIIKNSLGAVLLEQTIDCKQGTEIIDAKMLRNGIYTVSIISDNTVEQVQKVIIIK
jgi:hypothetical protein